MVGVHACGVLACLAGWSKLVALLHGSQLCLERLAEQVVEGVSSWREENVRNLIDCCFVYVLGGLHLHRQ